jgi:predicted GH43/DUF377 family glycosyl hydrolase
MSIRRSHVVRLLLAAILLGLIVFPLAPARANPISLPTLTVADFEGGVDARGVLYSSTGLSSSGPFYAWTPAQSDNVNYWDVVSDGDGIDEYVDYTLLLTPQNWERFTNLRIKFYTWASCPSGCNNPRAIQVYIHDADGTGNTNSGYYDLGKLTTDGTITLDFAGASNRDQIDQVIVRVHESFFGGVGHAGWQQRTHLYNLEVFNPTAVAFPTIAEHSFGGTAIIRPNTYDYAPSIMKDGNTYHMWWCSSRSSDTAVWDGIFMADSTDGIRWTNHRLLFGTTPSSQETNGQVNGHACDPSVVKVNGVFYLYYTAAGPTDGPTGQCPTPCDTYAQIFLATSTNNGATWTKYPNNANPTPVIPNTHPKPELSYGIGQSTVLYLNGRFYHYYTDASNAAMGTKLKLSYDGINWRDANNGNPVFSHYDFVPTYHKDMGVFVGVVARGESTNQGLYYSFSNDGITWEPNGLNGDFNIPLGNGRGATHNAGILTNEQGLAVGQKNQSTLTVYYGAGASATQEGNWQLFTWDIDRTQVFLNAPNTSRPYTTLADFESGVDARGSVYSPALLTTSGPNYAWEQPPSPSGDDINWWDVQSDSDSSNEYVDYTLLFTPQDWRAANRLQLKFYTDIYNPALSPANGAIRVYIHDADGTGNGDGNGYHYLGDYSDSATGSITLDLASVPNRDQINEVKVRVYESFFGGVGHTGWQQRTHLFSLKVDK